MTVSTATNMTHELASLIENDIQRLGLNSGDRYLTDREAAERFHVSQVTAHRAMRTLAERKIIVRRRRAGTFIGPEIKVKIPGAIQSVHYLLPSWFRDDYPLIEIINGMRQQTPGVQVQLNFLPEKEPLVFLRGLISQAAEAGTMFGIVVATASREVRLFFNKQNVPAIVSGHVESDVSLPWIDRDQDQIGHLLSQHLLDRNHRRVGLVMRDVWGPGDNVMTNSVERTLHDAGATLTMRSMPLEPDVIRQNVRDLLQHPDRPTGLICRSELQAKCCAEAAQSLGLTLSEDIDIVATRVSSNSKGFPFSFAHTSFAPVAFGKQLGQMLNQHAFNEHVDLNHYEMPVEMIIPDNHEN